MAMKKAALLLFVTATGASGLDLTLTADEKSRPIKKVVGLLQQMQAKIEAENDKDTALKAKFDCWCKQGTADKEKAIAENKEKIQILNTTLEETKARVEQLGPEIREHEKALQAAQATIQQATAIRENQIKSFKEDEATLLKNVAGVKDALKILQPKEGAFLELSKMSSGRLSEITQNLQNILDTQDVHFAKSMNRADRDQLEAWIQNPRGPAQGSFLQRGAADSIVGLLIAMADDFGADLAQELAEEKENKKNYDELMAAKKAEVEATTKSIAEKKEELAKAEKLVVVTEKDLKLTQKTLADDEKFMALVQEKCSNGDADYEARVKARQEEIDVVGKTIEILNSDEARDLDSSAMYFLQRSSSENAQRRTAASKVLATEGQRLNVASLVTLSIQAKINSFTKLKEKITDMINALKKQQADEVAFFDTCNENLKKNELDTDDKKNQKTTLESKIEELKTSIKELEAAIKSLTDELSELNQQMASATEERQKEHLDFQADVAEQKQVQALLQKASAVLQKFYGSASFLQVSRRKSADESTEEVDADAEQPSATSADPLGAPEQMKDYKKNSGGLAVTSLLTQIIEDSKKTEYKLQQSEQDSLNRYGAFAEETANSIKSKTAELESNQKQKADDSEDLAEAKGELDSTIGEMQQLSETRLDLHKECDFTIANFNVRQKAREEETDALVKAKGILSGASFTEFLQHSK